MPFLPIGECCLKGLVLPGEPRGTFEPISAKNPVGRYVATPSSGNLKAKDKAVVLFYDAFGLQIPNPKIMADAIADKLEVKVFVPDYIPSPIPVHFLDPVVPSYPNEHKDRSWFSTITGWTYGIFRALPYLPGLRGTGTRAQQALDQLKSEGYTDFTGIGFCMGGTTLIHMLASDNNPFSSAVIAHPGPEGKSYYDKISVPTLWCLASDDMRFGQKAIDELQASFKGRDVEFTLNIYPDTVHGFAARPNLEHEPTRKAFDEANESAVEFFRRHLLKE